MKKMKTIISVLFLIVVAINMMWTFAIKSLATNGSPPQSSEPLDTGQPIEEGTPKSTTRIEDIAKHPMFIFVDFVFWKAIGEVVTNFIKNLFQKNKDSKRPNSHKTKKKPKNKGRKKKKKK